MEAKKEELRSAKPVAWRIVVGGTYELFKTAQEACAARDDGDFVPEPLYAASVAPSQAPSRELPELPEAVAHVHSNGEVCMNRPVESNGVWPVELVTLKQAHDYARAYAAPVKGMEATSPMPKCMCGQPWVLNTVHRANSPCWLAQEPPGGLGPNPDGFAAALPSPDQPKADAGVGGKAK